MLYLTCLSTAFVILPYLFPFLHLAIWKFHTNKRGNSKCNYTARINYARYEQISVGLHSVTILETLVRVIPKSNRSMIFICLHVVKVFSQLALRKHSFLKVLLYVLSLKAADLVYP